MSNRRLTELREELATVENRIDDLQCWISNNINNPQFFTITRDRNVLLETKRTIEFKIEQVKAHLPILGEPQVGEIVRVSENPNQFKTM